MKAIITIGLILLNIFAIVITTKMLSGQDLGKKIAYVIGGEIAIFILCLIIYEISGTGVLDTVHQGAKGYILFTMIPINTIIMYCPIVSSINRRSLNKNTDEANKNKIILWAVCIMIFIIIEIIYIKNVQLGITNLAK